MKEELFKIFSLLVQRSNQQIPKHKVMVVPSGREVLAKTLFLHFLLTHMHIVLAEPKLPSFLLNLTEREIKHNKILLPIGWLHGIIYISVLFQAASRGQCVAKVILL